MRVHSDDIGKRFYLLNTLFTLPEACLYTDLVTHLEGLSQLKKSDDVTIEDISYANLFHDVRYAIDYVHTDNGPLKKKTLEDIERYIVRTEKLSIFLHTLKQWKKQTFLLTNSPWYYTDKVMSYLLDGFNDQYASWMGYFDQVIVSAAKPAFFMKGTTLREVDKETGQLKIGHVTGKFQPGSVYQGGNMALFEKLANVTSGDRVLYTGDHIFADIIISKKKHGWRTLLVVPELRKELKVWTEVQPIYQRLLKLEYIKSEIYRGMDYSAKSQPDTTLIRKQMREALEELNNVYNKWFGSLFRSGLKLSFFGMQVQRYADLYTTDYYNLLNYPMFYYFSPTPSLMQHEARHEDEHEMVF
jgi:5'-nucleotidase